MTRVERLLRLGSIARVWDLWAASWLREVGYALVANNAQPFPHSLVSPTVVSWFDAATPSRVVRRIMSQPNSSWILHQVRRAPSIMSIHG